MLKPYFSLVLPLYNEGPILEKSIRKIYQILQTINKPWEVIFVEDKSTDDTLKTIKRLLPNLKNSKLIQHKKNQGRGKTVRDGIISAKGDIVGFIDIDLEVSEKYIPIFIQEIEKGNDAIIGNRFYKRDFTAITRLLSSQGYKLLVHSLFKLPISDTETGYKFFKRKRILPVLKKTKNRCWFWDTEICVRAYMKSLKIKQVPVLFTRKASKHSTVRLIPDILTYLISLYNFRREISRNIANKNV